MAWSRHLGGLLVCRESSRLRGQRIGQELLIGMYRRKHKERHCSGSSYTVA